MTGRSVDTKLFISVFTSSRACLRGLQLEACGCSVLSGRPACEHTDMEQVL